MSDSRNRLISFAAVKSALRGYDRPRVLITGACQGVGRACAEALFSRGAELILCDRDAAGLTDVAEALEADSLGCNVASEASVQTIAAEVLDRYGSLDMVINSAGGGYERTLGMYRVSRALVPALRRGDLKLVVNIPPSCEDADAAIFPYASSRLAFHRLSAALAHETRGMALAVLIGCPGTGQVTHALPDPNAGTWAKSSNIRSPTINDIRKLAWHIASLIEGHASGNRRAS
jgi:NAD(P)-dependent dehydrogenase (short-subunit alcohol dehydrogenase family)